MTPPYYRCESCDYGERVQVLSNGTGLCIDVNECELYDPCDPRSMCVNQVPGFSCEACPTGYDGIHARGYYASHWNKTHRKQKCEDIDECKDDSSKCWLNSHCANTIVSRFWINRLT